ACVWVCDPAVGLKRQQAHAPDTGDLLDEGFDVRAGPVVHREVRELDPHGRRMAKGIARLRGGLVAPVEIQSEVRTTRGPKARSARYRCRRWSERRLRG